MRKNAPRKWLHAILDLLPVILIPVFMIYSHRHTIDSGSIDVPQNQVVDFNQLLNPILSQDNFGIDLEFENNEFFIGSGTGSNNGPYLGIGGDSAIIGKAQHKYYCKTDSLDNENIQIRIQAYNTIQSYFTYPTNSIFTLTYDTNIAPWLYVAQGYQITNYTFHIYIVDLTQMFGFGNEPTIQQFETWYPNDYYSYTLSHKELLKDTSTITYDDTDIMSQVVYQLYNSVDKYFNMNNVFNMGAVYDWFVLNIFNGNAPLIMYIVWNIALYELVMDLMFLLYALFMWFVDWCKSLIERTYDVGRGK